MDLNVDQWVMSQWSQVTHDLRGPSRFVDPLTRWPSSAPRHTPRATWCTVKCVSCIKLIHDVREVKARSQHMNWTVIRDQLQYEQYHWNARVQN